MATLSLKSMRISHRLWIILAFTGFGVIALTAAFLFAERNALMNDHRVRVKHLAEVATGIVSSYQKQEAAGSLSREQAQTAARNILRSLRYGDNDYIYVYDFDGNGVVVPGKEEMEGKNFLGKSTSVGEKIWDMVTDAGKKGGGYMDYHFPRYGSNEPVAKVSYTVGFPAWRWAIGTGVYVDDVDAVFYSRLKLAAALSGLGLALAFGLGYLISRSIINQLGGEPAYAADVMRRVAEGDLTVQVEAENQDSLLGSLSVMLEALRGMIGNIAASSRSVEEESGQVARTSRAVAQNAERQSDSTATMAAAMEEMTVSINHISDSARETEENSTAAAQLASSGETQTITAVAEIRRIADTVGNATEKIRQLVARASEIGSAATVIKEIAGQTNLLALNAAIEAARAGEQGRGFAVVADEVRALAERTSTATVQIEQMIKTIQDDTANAVSAMESARVPVARGVSISEEVAESLRGIRGRAHATQERIREVASATQEQSVASNSLAAQVEQIAQLVENTSTSMRETADTAQRLQSCAHQLRDSVGRFRY